MNRSNNSGQATSPTIEENKGGNQSSSRLASGSRINSARDDRGVVNSNSQRNAIIQSPGTGSNMPTQPQTTKNNLSNTTRGFSGVSKSQKNKDCPKIVMEEPCSRPSIEKLGSIVSK